MSTVSMFHEVDPRQTIYDNIGSVDHIKILGNQVLVATYIRPKRTKGNIILPDTTRAEDKFQGKVGLVLAIGEQAFVDDGQTRFTGRQPQVGDWIAYRMSDGWQFTIKGNKTPDSPQGEHHCRMLIDIDVKAILSHPDDVI